MFNRLGLWQTSFCSNAKLFVENLSKKTCKILPAPGNLRRKSRAVASYAPPSRSRRLAGVGVEMPAVWDHTRTKKKVLRALQITEDEEGIDQQSLDK